MVTHLPMDGDQFVRTANVMIAERGDAAIGAIGAVDQRIGICKFEGLDSVAKTWRLIREVIRDMQESDDKERHA